jgi:hypothetical protein
MSLAPIICWILARFELELIFRTHACFQLVSSMIKMPLVFTIELIEAKFESNLVTWMHVCFQLDSYMPLAFYDLIDFGLGLNQI